MTTGILHQFHCTDCGNLNWIYTEEFVKTTSEFCVQCNEETTHERLNSKGR